MARTYFRHQPKPNKEVFVRKPFLLIFTAIVFAGFLTGGCAKKEANSQQAIEQSKSMKTVDEQVKYLTGQANDFINSKQFDQAIATAKYVLANLDPNSSEAKSILAKAQAELTKTATAVVGDMKNKFGVK